MPELLQRQIKFGIELRRLVDAGETPFEDLLSAVLTGRADWDKLYSENVGAFEAQNKAPQADWMIDCAERERDAFEKLWNNNYGGAATAYSGLAADADSHDKYLAAWYRHWEGLAHTLNKDSEAAIHAYIRAANTRSELGRPQVKAAAAGTDKDLRPGPQAKRIAALLATKRPGYVKRIGEIKSALNYENDTNPVEQALSDLGKLLGLEASRPDHELNTGPDVLWRSPEHKAGAALEAKTKKQAPSQYQKKEDIGQFHDHAQWLQKQHPGESFYKAIVGRKLAVSKDANPPVDLRLIGLEQFVGLADRLDQLVEFVDSVANGTDLEITIERALRHLGLIWPNCIESLESSLAIDLQQSDEPEATTGD